MIDENELIKSLEDLTNEYRDKQANAKNEKHNAFFDRCLRHTDRRYQYGSTLAEKEKQND